MTLCYSQSMTEGLSKAQPLQGKLRYIQFCKIKKKYYFENGDYSFFFLFFLSFLFSDIFF